jgi:hypothetical protein
LFSKTHYIGYSWRRKFLQRWRCNSRSYVWLQTLCIIQYIPTYEPTYVQTQKVCCFSFNNKEPILPNICNFVKLLVIMYVENVEKTQSRKTSYIKFHHRPVFMQNTSLCRYVATFK